MTVITLTTIVDLTVEIENSLRKYKKLTGQNLNHGYDGDLDKIQRQLEEILNNVSNEVRRKAQ
jgi:hypothetical protein